MQIKRILFPTDFSKTAYLALQQALVLATRYQAELVVLHARLIHEDDPSQLPEKLAHLKMAEHEIEGEILKYIEECTSQADQVQIKHEVIRGYSAHSAILSYLNDNDFDLIVMGSHGRSNLEQLLLGSVAEKVVRYASCPVLTVSRDAEIKNEFKRVLVPFDFKEHSVLALATALQISHKQAQIDLLYVFEKDVHPAHYAWNFASALDLMPEVSDKAKTKMDEILSGLNTGRHKINKFILEGVAHKKITEFANKNDVDLVILASQGLVGLDRFLLGSTTEHIIRTVSQPILTLKQRTLI